MWDETIESLEGSHQIVALDLPGFGSNAQQATSITEMARYVFEEMRIAGMKSAILIGHSMGGYVALELAKMRPGSVEAIALVHSHGAADDDVRQANRTKLVDFLTRNPAQAFLKPFAKDLVGAPNKDDRGLASRIWSLVKDTDASGISNAATAMKHRADHMDFLSRFDRPVLWVVGQYDQFMSMDEILGQVAQTNHAVLELIPNAGHMSMYEAPERFHMTLAHFVSYVERLP